MPTRYTNLPDNKNEIFGGAYSVHDDELCAYRDLIINKFTLHNNYLRDNAETIKSDFLETYKTWMFSTHNMKGAGQFTEGCFTNGTIESSINSILGIKILKG